LITGISKYLVLHLKHKLLKTKDRILSQELLKTGDDEKDAILAKQLSKIKKRNRRNVGRFGP
jgi:hypothetical protein